LQTKLEKRVCGDRKWGKVWGMRDYEVETMLGLVPMDLIEIVCH